MAKVVWSPLVSSARGRLGGLVAQGAPGGDVLRALVRPPGRLSEASGAARAAFTAAASAWRTLTPTQRLYWAAVARPYSPTSPGPGLSVSLGRQAFVSWYSALVGFGVTPTLLTPLVEPFLTVAALVWAVPEPYSPGDNVLVEMPAAPLHFRLWVRYAPNFPQFSGRGPWVLAYDTTRDGALSWSGGPRWTAEIPDSFADIVDRYGAGSWFEARCTAATADYLVARTAAGYAHLRYV